MAMNRAEKQQMIEKAQGRIKDASVLILVHNKGLTVAEVSDLRRKMREAGASYDVVKNRLAKIALKDSAYSGVSDLLKGPTVMATAADPVACAKTLVNFAKTNEKLVILGGAFGTQALDKKAVETLATLPSLDELRGKIVGLLQAPAQKILGVLQAPGGQVARVIAAKAKKE